MDKKQLRLYTVLGIVVYGVVTGLSFLGFKAVMAKGVTSGQDVPTLNGQAGKPVSNFRVDPALPRTEICPLNGLLFTKGEKETWEKRRPLAVMIENHAESRPQSGLSFADVVYEAVAEGGITRFMGVFYCGVAAGNVNLAPVRSARAHFLPWVLEYDALYNHVGGAGKCNDDTVDVRAKALCQIGEYKIKDMDQFGISFPTCYRNYDRLDHPVATEHTMVCLTDKLYKLAADRAWTNVDSNGKSWDAQFEQWKFKDSGKDSSGNVAAISYVAWKGYEAQYGVRWEYDKTQNIYKRFNGGAAHLDLETNEQLTAKNVVILFAKETGSVDIHAHILYNNIGSGEAIFFMNGQATSGTWKKATKNARTKFYDKAGKEINFVPGVVWVSMLPTGTQVTY